MSGEKMTLQIREADAGSAADIAAMEAACFPADAWSEETVRDSMKYPVNHFLIAEADGRPAGYCSCRICLDEGDILRVAVLPEFRRKKIGAALMQGQRDHFPEVTQWNLDVRAGNEPAQKLYRNFGFRVIGSRAAYYHDPTEDAWIMQCFPAQTAEMMDSVGY